MTFLAPLWNQKLGYTGMNDRQVLASILQPGVAGIGDMLCAAGTGFTSTIAGGKVAVEGNFQTAQGIYVVQNTGPVSVTHPNPNGSLPRIDQIGVKVYDSTDGGDASDGALSLILEGTPTSGATLPNAETHGLAAVPHNFFAFARVLVPAAAGSAASFAYEDRRVFMSNYVKTGPSGISAFPFMSWGVVSAAGVIEAGSGDFTIEHSGGSQNYRINWRVAKSSAIYAIACSELKATTPGACSYSNRTKEFFEVNTSATETPFSFIVLAAP